MTRKSDPGAEQGKVKVRFFEFEVSGDDHTIQEGLRSMTAALNRAMGASIVPTKRVNTLPAAAETGNGHDNGSAIVDLDGVTDEGESGTSDVETTPVSGSRTARERRYTVPQALAIDLTSGMAFRDYASEYNLDGDQSRYLTIGGWLKEHRQLPISGGALLTIYKEMDWQVQKDITMPLRKLASKNFQWFRRVGRGEYEITHIGEGELRKLKQK